MAKIELDISEYDLLRDKSKLLEEALSREKIWSEQVDKLNQEKIEAYQKAEKQIVIRKITEKREYRIPSTFSVDRLQLLIRRVVANDPAYGNMDSAKFIVSVIDEVMKDKAETISTKEESQEFVGLDEFKLEAEKAAFEKLSKKAKEALEKEPIYNKAILESKDFEKKLFDLFESNQKLLKDLETSKEFGRTRLIIIQEIADYFYSIHKDHLHNINIFNYRSKIKELISYLGKFNEKFKL